MRSSELLASKMSFTSKYKVPTSHIFRKELGGGVRFEQKQPKKATTHTQSDQRGKYTNFALTARIRSHTTPLTTKKEIAFPPSNSPLFIFFREMSAIEVQPIDVSTFPRDANDEGQSKAIASSPHQALERRCGSCDHLNSSFLRDGANLQNANSRCCRILTTSQLCGCVSSLLIPVSCDFIAVIEIMASMMESRQSRRSVRGRCSRSPFFVTAQKIIFSLLCVVFSFEAIFVFRNAVVNMSTAPEHAVPLSRPSLSSPSSSLPFFFCIHHFVHSANALECSASAPIALSSACTITDKEFVATAGCVVRSTLTNVNGAYATERVILKVGLTNASRGVSYVDVDGAQFENVNVFIDTTSLSLVTEKEIVAEDHDFVPDVGGAGGGGSLTPNTTALTPRVRPLIFVIRNSAFKVDRNTHPATIFFSDTSLPSGSSITFKNNSFELRGTFTTTSGRISFIDIGVPTFSTKTSIVLEDNTFFMNTSCSTGVGGDTGNTAIVTFYGQVNPPGVYTIGRLSSLVLRRNNGTIIQRWASSITGKSTKFLFGCDVFIVPALTLTDSAKIIIEDSSLRTLIDPVTEVYKQCACFALNVKGDLTLQKSSQIRINNVTSVTRNGSPSMLKTQGKVTLDGKESGIRFADGSIHTEFVQRTESPIVATYSALGAVIVRQGAFIEFDGCEVHTKGVQMVDIPSGVTYVESHALFHISSAAVTLQSGGYMQVTNAFMSSKGPLALGLFDSGNSQIQFALFALVLSSLRIEGSNAPAGVAPSSIIFNNSRIFSERYGDYFPSTTRCAGLGMLTLLSVQNADITLLHNALIYVGNCHFNFTSRGVRQVEASTMRLGVYSNGLMSNKSRIVSQNNLYTVIDLGFQSSLGLYNTNGRVLSSTNVAMISFLFISMLIRENSTIFVDDCRIITHSSGAGQIMGVYTEGATLEVGDVGTTSITALRTILPTISTPNFGPDGSAVRIQKLKCAYFSSFQLLDHAVGASGMLVNGGKYIMGRGAVNRDSIMISPLFVVVDCVFEHALWRNIYDPFVKDRRESIVASYSDPTTPLTEEVLAGLVFSPAFVDANNARSGWLTLTALFTSGFTEADVQFNQSSHCIFMNNTFNVGITTSSPASKTTFAGVTPIPDHSSIRAVAVVAVASKFSYRTRQSGGPGVVFASSDDGGKTVLGKGWEQVYDTVANRIDFSFVKENSDGEGMRRDTTTIGVRNQLGGVGRRERLRRYRSDDPQQAIPLIIAEANTIRRSMINSRATKDSESGRIGLLHMSWSSDDYTLLSTAPPPPMGSLIGHCRNSVNGVLDASAFVTLSVKASASSSSVVALPSASIVTGGKIAVPIPACEGDAHSLSLSITGKTLPLTDTLQLTSTRATTETRTLTVSKSVVKTQTESSGCTQTHDATPSVDPIHTPSQTLRATHTAAVSVTAGATVTATATVTPSVTKPSLSDSLPSETQSFTINASVSLSLTAPSASKATPSSSRTATVSVSETAPTPTVSGSPQRGCPSHCSNVTARGATLPKDVAVDADFDGDGVNVKKDAITSLPSPSSSPSAAGGVSDLDADKLWRRAANGFYTPCQLGQLAEVGGRSGGEAVAFNVIPHTRWYHSSAQQAGGEGAEKTTSISANFSATTSTPAATATHTDSPAAGSEANAPSPSPLISFATVHLSWPSRHIAPIDLKLLERKPVSAAPPSQHPDGNSGDTTPPYSLNPPREDYQFVNVSDHIKSRFDLVGAPQLYPGGATITLRIAHDDEEQMFSYLLVDTVVLFFGCFESVPVPISFTLAPPPPPLPVLSAPTVAASTAAALASGLVSGGSAAMDMQTLALLGLSACAKGSAKTKGGMALRSIAPLATDDTCHGAVVGNYLTIGIVSALHLVLLIFKKKSLTKASEQKLAEYEAASFEKGADVDTDETTANDLDLVLPPSPDDCGWFAAFDATKYPALTLQVVMFLQNGFSLCGFHEARNPPSSLEANSLDAAIITAGTEEASTDSFLTDVFRIADDQGAIAFGVSAIVWTALPLAPFLLIAFVFASRAYYPLHYHRIRHQPFRGLAEWLLPSGQLDKVIRGTQGFGMVVGKYQHPHPLLSLYAFASFVASLPITIGTGDLCPYMYGTSMGLHVLFGLSILVLRPFRVRLTNVLQPIAMLLNAAIIGHYLAILRVPYAVPRDLKESLEAMAIVQIVVSSLRTALMVLNKVYVFLTSNERTQQFHAYRPFMGSCLWEYAAYPFPNSMRGSTSFTTSDFLPTTGGRRKRRDWTRWASLRHRIEGEADGKVGADDQLLRSRGNASRIILFGDADGSGEGATAKEEEDEKKHSMEVALLDIVVGLERDERVRDDNIIADIHRALGAKGDEGEWVEGESFVSATKVARIRSRDNGDAQKTNKKRKRKQKNAKAVGSEVDALLLDTVDGDFDLLLPPPEKDTDEEMAVFCSPVDKGHFTPTTTTRRGSSTVVPKEGGVRLSEVTNADNHLRPQPQTHHPHRSGHVVDIPSAIKVDSSRPRLSLESKSATQPPLLSVPTPAGNVGRELGKNHQQQQRSAVPPPLLQPPLIPSLSRPTVAVASSPSSPSLLPPNNGGRAVVAPVGRELNGHGQLLPRRPADNTALLPSAALTRREMLLNIVDLNVSSSSDDDAGEQRGR